MLLRYRTKFGGTYLRDLPGDGVSEEVHTRYHGKPDYPTNG